MFKKILAGILTTSILFSLVACSESNNDSTNENKKSDFKSSEEITVISREDGSGTRGAFIELVDMIKKDSNGNKTDLTTTEAIIANKTDVMLTNVAGDEYSIGYVSMGSLNDKVKALKVNGNDPTSQNVKNGSYKLARPFNIATSKTPDEITKDFISYILSSDGQKIVSDKYISIKDDAAPYSGTKPSGKIVIAGSSSVAPVMEKLAEGYKTINPNAVIELQSNDSTTGMNAVMEGTVSIGMASRNLKENESAAVSSTEIALDGIAVIVNNSNPLNDLTTEQIKNIFTGTYSTWELK